MILVMTVLPQFILLLDRLIDRTSFELHLPSGEEDEMTVPALPEVKENSAAGTEEDTGPPG